MLRNKLIYAALLVAMVLFWILYRGALSLEILVFTAVLPIVLWIMLWIMRFSLHCSIRHTGEPLTKGKTFFWILQIRNSSFIPAAHAVVHLEYSTSLADSPQKLKISVPILMRNTQRIRLKFHAAACGAIRMRIHALDIYDPLRLFRRRIRLRISDTAQLLPEKQPLPDAFRQGIDQHDTESKEFSKDKPGDDPSEVFDLHDYREGDPVSRIHWKLSSKLDRTMVKEYSLPLTGVCLLLADYRHAAEQPESALRLDAVLSALHTAAAHLSEEQQPFALAAMIPQTGCIEAENAASAEDIAAWLQHLLASPPQAQSTKQLFYAALTAYLTEQHAADRVMLFTPLLDDAAVEALAALPHPERITVFSAVTASQSVSAKMLPFVQIAVAVPEPETVPSEADEEDDSDDENPAEGDADI